MSQSKLWSPLDAAHVQDPYPMYSRLRQEDPVHQAQTGEWIISRYADVKHILKSKSFRSGNRLEWLNRSIDYFKNRDAELQHIYTAINAFILFLNAPDHTLIRNFVARAWDDRDVETLIRETAQQLLQSIEQDNFDLVKDFAQPLPSRVISSLMGIPQHDYQQLMTLGLKMLRAVDLYPSYKEFVELSEVSREFIHYFRTLIQFKTDHPDDALISKLIRNNSQKTIREEQLISLCIFLFIAGEESTAGSISTGLHHLVKHPELYAYLKQHPDELPCAVEELFRYDSAVQFLGRISMTDVVLDGHHIPAESTFTLVIGGANRDPLQFENPDQLIIQRSPNQHLSFGTGVHYCLGEWLARIQTKIAVHVFIQSFQRVHIFPQPIVWNKNISIRSMRSLHVRGER